MKKIVAFLLIIHLYVSLLAQKEANNWFLGQNAGITFNSGAPVAVTTGQLNTLEGCSSISDENGNLLFYTDGIRVWNRNHVIMTNGNNLKGDPSSTQSGIIIPKPGSTSTYYIFTVDMQGGLGLLAGDADGTSNGLMYSEVDMTASAGLGSVVLASKNVPLTNPTTEGLSAVKDANGVDYWVVTHGCNNNNYIAYHVTAAGVNTTPVISSSGPVVSVTPNSPFFGAGAIGYTKISPSGQKIAACHSQENNQLVISDFNPATGVVSNSVTIPILLDADSDGPYGVEFSNCNEFVYVSEGFVSTHTSGTVWPKESRIWRFDLNAGSIPASKSLFQLIPNQLIAALQLAVDGKIYCARMVRTGTDSTNYGYGNGNSLHAINNPRLAGATFTNNAVNLAGKFSRLGLPPFIVTYFYNTSIAASNIATGDTALFCRGDSVLFKGIASAYDSLRWNFDDPASGALNNTSTAVNPKHLFSAPGNYTITLIKYLCNIKDTAVKNITVTPLPVPVITSSNSNLCLNATRTLVATPSGGTFTIISGTGTIAGTTLTATGTGTIQLRYSLTVAGCTGTTTQSIPVIDCSCPNSPSVSLSAFSGSTCGTSPKTVSANTFGGSATSVTVTENGAGTVSPASANSSPFSFTYTPAAGDIGNTVTITVTTNNPLGSPCTAATATYALTVNALPTPVFTSSNAAMCVNDMRTLAVTPTGGTFSVLSGPGTVAGTTLTATGAGTIQLQYSVTVAGCTGTTTQSITVNALPTPVFTSSNAAMCVNDTKTLAATPSGGTFSVLSGPGTVAGTTLTATGAGTIQLQYSVTVAGCTGTTTQSITVNPIPTPAFTSSNAAMCVYDMRTLAATPTGGAFSVLSGPGTVAGTTLTATGAGTIQLQYSVTVAGCPGTTTQNITVNSCGCSNAPTVSLSASSGSTCGTSPKTVSANIFGGSATSVTVTENGAGTVSPASANSSPFSFTYTPAAGDAGNTVTITVTTDNPSGSPCTPAVATYALTVNALPTPVFTSSNAAMCVNDTKTLAATPSGGTFSVLSGPGTVAGTTLTATGAGTIQIQYSVTVAGCTGTTTQSITVNPIPTPAFTSGNAAMCVNDTRTLAATPTGGTFSVLSGPVTVAGTTLTATGAGTIQIQYSVTVAGCTGTTTQSITVNPKSTPAFTSSNAAMCVNDTRTLAATPTGGTFSVLSGPGTVTGTTLTATGAGTIQIQYSVTVAGCASGIAIQDIIVHAKPAVSVNSPVICSGTSATLIALGADSYTWSGGLPAGDTVQTPLLNTTTSYTVTGTSSGCSGSALAKVTVQPVPQIDAVSNKTLVKYGQEVQLNVINTSGVIQYNWTALNPLSNAAIRNPTSVINTSGWFVVTVQDAKNCTTSDSVYIELINDCSEDYIFVPTAFSPNNDGVNDCFVILSPPALTDFSMIIFNRWGELVFETYDVNTCWDGTFKGTDAMADTYIVLIGFTCYDGSKLSKKGTVVIVK